MTNVTVTTTNITTSQTVHFSELLIGIFVIIVILLAIIIIIKRYDKN